MDSRIGEFLIPGFPVTRFIALNIMATAGTAAN